MTESKPLMLLVDGSSYLYRAFHAMPDLRGPDGQATGAVHGVVAMMRRLRDQFKPERAVCVFDAKGPTFRDEWYPEYKAQRAPMPEPLREQIPLIHEVVRLLGWPILEVPGIEADDAIGTLARVAAQQGHRVIISTGDKDLAQLVTPEVSLINTMSNEGLTEEGVMDKFGVPPNRIIDYLTLMGDTVDNVPGVEKVGPKTAAKWIAEYGSLDGVIAAAGSIKGVAGENLRKALDWLPMGRQLVTVKTDCDLHAHVTGWPALESLAIGAVDSAGLLAFFRQHGFKTWMRELEGAGVAAAGPSTVAEPTDALPPPPLQDKHYDTVTSWPAFETWLAKIQGAELVALDTETDSLNNLEARIVGLSFSVAPFEACYIPLRHAGMDAPEQLPLDEVLARLKPWLEDAARSKLGQHVKYDAHVFANHGIQIRGYAHDTMLQSYVLEAHKSHSLEALADRELGRKGLSYEDLCGKGAKQIPFAQVDVARAAEYSCEDSEMCLGVHQRLLPRIQADAGLRTVYEQIEMPTSAQLLRVERNGVLIDAERLRAHSHELGQRLLQLEAELAELAGQPFNIGSPKQIGEILFGKLGLPVKKKTATGAPSTDEEVLTELAADFPLPAKILEHRSLAKLKSTYTDKLPLMINAGTGRVHTHYAQAVAVTGRLASNDPNLQNIPVRTAEGRRIREAFIAPPGRLIASADYSQIELRIMAHLSGDEAMLAAFASGADIHKATAAEVFGAALDQVTGEQRRAAKAINFGLIYGMGAYGLASQLGIEPKAAKDYIDKYFARFQGVRAFMDETRASAKAKGFVETVFGRRLWLPEINSGNGPRRAGAERQAINAPMQGTAADLIKLAMLAVQKALDQEGKQTLIVMQVHDELVFELPEAERDWVAQRVPDLMAGVAQLKVPLLAEVGFGASWEAAH
ncbi:DNA polymerase-1 [Inhella inkyongensis]|uniref:DNA polymerase I n=1 Tax=Inhella inkyongensis TaxID=392593 RepID=A0A840S6L3_9BURK|nr:DNA polymerase I [Inhella inkyongensis]MBB5204231.1 DNA polymerase-1 [Inhella inkyongensis]